MALKDRAAHFIQNNFGVYNSGYANSKLCRVLLLCGVKFGYADSKICRVLPSALALYNGIVIVVWTFII